MNRTVTFLLFTAVLMAGLGWFFDGREPNPKEESNASTKGFLVSELQTQDASKSSPEHAPIDGSIELELLAVNVATSKETPIAGLKLEVFFEDHAIRQHLALTGYAISLGTTTTDENGIATMRVVVPTTAEDGLPVRGTLFVRCNTIGWQQPMRNLIVTHSEMENEVHQTLHFTEGATIRVRPLGLDPSLNLNPPARMFLNVEAIDFKMPRILEYFTAKIPDATDFHAATLNIPKAGRYRLHAQGPGGVGLVPSIFLDPASPPEEITILIEKFGVISGQVQFPQGFTPPPYMIMRAVAVDRAQNDALLWTSYFQEQSSPATMSDATWTEGGNFHFAGLAPGKYRIGFLLFGGFGEARGWFTQNVFQTGDSNVSLFLPTPFVEVKFVSGKESKAELTGRLALEELHTVTAVGSYLNHPIERVVGPNGRLGYYLLGGEEYRFLVYGPDLPLYEVDLPNPFTGPIIQVKVPDKKQAAGFILCEGPSENVVYEVRSPKLNLLVESWIGNKGNSWRDKRFKLPPGDYKVLAYGWKGAAFAEQEKLVNVVSGESTHLEFDLPPAGWLFVSLLNEGGKPQWLDRPEEFPPLENVVVRLPHWGLRTPRLVMRPRDGSAALGLTFLRNDLLSPKHRATYLHAGEEFQAIESLAPGIYDLEVRVPGYPRQILEVEIFQGELTKVSIQLEQE